MTESMLTLSGKRFVVLPEREYRKLKAKAEGKPVGRSVRGTRRPSTQEAGDIAESKRRLANPRRVPAEDVFRQLGV